MIRRYTPNDRQTVYDMFVEFYNSPAVLHNVDTQFFKNTLDQLDAGSPYTELFLLEQEQSVVGYGLVALTYSNEVGGQVVWLEELYVRKEYRSCGLGREYFKFIFDNYPAAKRFRLEVEPDNTRAISLYERLEFTKLNYLQYVRDLD